MRLVVDSASGELVYRTADYHRPWNIGVTPDPEIAATLEQLTIDLGPTLGRVIGSAVQPIPRADACGMETGRTCESLIGDVVADALRTTYGDRFRHHQLGRYPRRPDVSAGRGPVLSYGCRPASDHRGTGPDRAALR